jgi:hypothetical protein
MKIHVLEGGSNNLYQVVVHTPAPTGNNAAGVAWGVAIANSGHAVSVMPVGNGPGQIAQAELNQVQAGSVIEGTFPWEDNPAWTATERAADLDLRATQMADNLSTTYQTNLKYFGMTRT